MPRRRPLVADKTTEVLLGALLLGGGFWLWYDAWEGRGGQTPKALRWLTWW